MRMKIVDFFLWLSEHGPETWRRLNFAMSLFVYAGKKHAAKAWKIGPEGRKKF